MREHSLRIAQNVNGLTDAILPYVRPFSSKQADNLASRRRREWRSEEIHPGLAPSTSLTPAQKHEARSVPPASTQPESTRPSADGTPSDLEMINLADEERNGLEIASAALGQPDRVGDVPFYAGKLDQPCTQI